MDEIKNMYETTDFTPATLREAYRKVTNISQESIFTLFYDQWVNNYFAASNCEIILDPTLAFGEIQYTFGISGIPFS